MGVARSKSQFTLKMGLLDSFKKIVGGVDAIEALAAENDKALKGYMQRVEQVNALEESYEQLSDEALRSKTQELRARVQAGESLESVQVEAFAAVREGAWRVLELRHFDVQLMGGMALHEGRLAEMATGEGKTLVAVLAVYLNALAGEGAYVVTTNDYLARRDGENMGQVYRFLGLTVGVVQNYQTEAQRRAAYACDVTYVPNQELGFDFLRDNLAMTMENVVQ
ncbi:SecA DEAD-like protein, partial [Ochromonadaceae sp. CCMP2298]